jgi:hypothetical protein
MAPVFVELCEVGVAVNDLSGFRVLDKSAAVWFLFVVSGKRGPQGGSCLIGSHLGESRLNMKKGL